MSTSIRVRTEIYVLSRSLHALGNALKRQSPMWTVEQIYFQSRCHCELLCISSYQFYLIGTEWIVFILVTFLHVMYCVQIFSVIWLYIFIIILHVLVEMCIKAKVAPVRAMKCIWDFKWNLYSDEEFIIMFACSPKMCKFVTVCN